MFTPNLKRKRGARDKWETAPFPSINTANEQKFEGIFTGISVEILDSAAIVAIYENGCYGKGNKSRGAPQSIRHQPHHVTTLNNITETLTLNLEEAFFLSYYLNVLTITDVLDNVLTWQEFIKEALAVDSIFIEKFAVYLYLKSKAWIVKSGIKYGGHFLIYKQNPRLYHASFVVLAHSQSITRTNHFFTKDLKGLQRIAEAASKDVLILDVLMPACFQLNKLNKFKQILVTETIVRRFNQTAYVAQHNKSKKNK